MKGLHFYPMEPLHLDPVELWMFHNAYAMIVLGGRLENYRDYLDNIDENLEMKEE